MFVGALPRYTGALSSLENGTNCDGLHCRTGPGLVVVVVVMAMVGMVGVAMACLFVFVCVCVCV